MFAWLLIMPSGLYTDGNSSSTLPFIDLTHVMSGQACVELMKEKGGHCRAICRIEGLQRIDGQFPTIPTPSEEK